MYLASDYFLSENATVEVTNGENVTSDVHILIRDANGSFQISAYMSYREMQDLVGTYLRCNTHSRMKFGDFTVFSPHRTQIDDLKFTLEMM